MSDVTTTETAAETVTTTETKKKARKATRFSVKLEAVRAMAEELGLTPLLKNGVEHKSSVQYGDADGVRVAIAKNDDVSRVFLYGMQPEGAFVHYTDEERKAQGLGLVSAEVDFTQSSEAALEAVRLALVTVKNAPPPAPKAVAKPKKVKEPKAAVETASTPSVEASAEVSA